MRTIQTANVDYKESNKLRTLKKMHKPQSFEIEQVIAFSQEDGSWDVVSPEFQRIR